MASPCFGADSSHSEEMHLNYTVFQMVYGLAGRDHKHTFHLISYLFRDKSVGLAKKFARASPMDVLKSLNEPCSQQEYPRHGDHIRQKQV